MTQERRKQLFFWGQFAQKEFAMSFCTAWSRNIGEVEHFSYRARISDVGEEAAFTEGIDRIISLKPDYVVVWQGNNLNALRSTMIRDFCDDVGAKFVFISLDDPFWLENHQEQPYKNAHVIVTCCMEARETYQARCENNPEIIFAPPACSIDYHIAPSRHIVSEKGVFFFFTNPYLGEVYQKYGAFNRFEIMQGLISKGVRVGFASTQQNEKHSFFTEDEWKKIEWQGLVPYEQFYLYDSWALHFNSNVVGRDYVYFNQRVFEILGIGGVQLIDAGVKCRKFYERLCKHAAIPLDIMPFIFYDSIDECVERSIAFLESPRRKQEQCLKAARWLRWVWTFDHLVRRVVYGEEENTIFDAFEATNKIG